MIITTTNQTELSEAIELFSSASKGIQQKAISFINGNLTAPTARAFIGLSSNSKMPAYTFAIPAREACPRGDKLGQIEGTVCFGCYATKGHDAMAPARNAKARRWDVVKLALESQTVRGLWLKAFVLAMTKETHFRWHSAGDLFSLEYAELVAEACKLTPHVKHWIPTRERRNALPLLGLDNVVVRVSDDMVNQETNKHKGNTSGVHTPEHGGRGVECIAYKQQGSCGDCRACWSPEVAHVSYKIH